MPGSRDSDDLCSQEVVISTGWTLSNSDAGKTLKNANEEVDNNNSEFTKEKESDQASHKNSNIKGNKKSNPTTENDSAVKGKKKSRQVSFKPRKKRICPLKGWKSRVVDLPRHLRDVHKWARNKAQKATSHFRMRESFSSEVVENGKAKKWKDYHHHPKCPIPGCCSVVKWLSHHLKQVHKGIKKGSLEYKAALKEARPIKPWRSSARVLKTVDEAEKRLSNQSDSNSAARISVQEDSGEVSGEEGSESSGDTTDNWGYEGKSDSESQSEGGSAGTVETSKVVFCSFASWLQTADGGRKPEKISKQHASQLDKMLGVIDPEKDVASLFDKKLICDKFLKKHAENTYKLDTNKNIPVKSKIFLQF